MSDLEYFRSYCATSGGTINGQTFEPSFHRFMEVRAVTERGWSFLTAYWQVTDKKHAYETVIEDDGSERPESLQIFPEDFDRLKKQASLAGTTMIERKRHWDYDDEEE